MLAAGSASLRIDGEDMDLVSPRLIGGEEDRSQLPGETKLPSDRMGVTDFLRMDLAAG